MDDKENLLLPVSKAPTKERVRGWVIVITFLFIIVLCFSIVYYDKYHYTKKEQSADYNECLENNTKIFCNKINEDLKLVRGAKEATDEYNNNVGKAEAFWNSL